MTPAAREKRRKSDRAPINVSTATKRGVHVNDAIRALAAYLAIINLVTAILYVGDKRRAIAHRRRVPERTLLLFAAFGGTPAALLSMHLAHHKTRKPRFAFGVPAMLVAQLALAGLVVWLANGRPAFWM